MLVVLAVLVLGLVPSTPTVVERTEYYEVSGSSERELRVAIDQARPKDQEGVRHDAVTNWDVRWKYRYETVNTGCALASLETTLEVVSIFPRWSNRGSGSPLAQRWDKYLAALDEHEVGHLQIARRAAREIHERLSELNLARTCPLLKESIDSKGRALLDQFRSEGAEYDRQTKHGASQGARFP
jgi:predicted secreted Zn-dependent protease